MANWAEIKDGKVVNQQYTKTNKIGNTKTEKNAGSSLDKDAFLQLLVAEMQYQDPLQPTDNTEYISQFATFSQLEELQNMEKVSQQQFAANLVGKQVEINHIDSDTSKTQTISGEVNYTYNNNGTVMLAVNGQEYPLSELSSVIDPEYMEAVEAVSDLEKMLLRLPEANELTLDNKEDVEAVRAFYDNMSEYQKGLVPSSLTTRLTDSEKVIQALG